MKNDAPKFEVRDPNWLPVPFSIERAPDVQVVEENDLFPKGSVSNFYPRQGYGAIKDAKGIDLYFNLDEAELVGPKGDKKYLGAGKRVGFDRSRTSEGERIIKIKVY